MPRPTGMRRDGHARKQVRVALLTAAGIAALVLAHIASTSQVTAQPGTCVTAGAVAALVQRKYSGQEVVHLTGAAGKAFVAGFANKMAAFNRRAPRPVVLADEAFILFHPDHGMTRIAFFANGCVVGFGNARVDITRALLAEIQGRNA